MAATRNHKYNKENMNQLNNKQNKENMNRLERIKRGCSLKNKESRMDENRKTGIRNV